MTEEPTISVSSQPARVDDELRIRATGFEPGERVRLVIRSQWTGPRTAEATFEANPQGTIDLAEQAPISGAYEGIEPMGLFTRLAPADHEFSDETTDFPSATLTASVDGETVASADVERQMADDDVETIDVAAECLTGKLYKPASEGPHPGIVVIDGSGGGHADSVRPSILASQGYLVVGLAYFGVDDRPEALREISVEYFEQAADWLLEREDCSGSLAAIGTSRGAEMACHLGTSHREVSVVVSYVGSPIRYESPDKDGEPAWVSDADELPFVETVSETAPSTRDEYASAREAIERVVIDSSNLEDAFLPLEEAEAEYLFFSAADDELWASWALSSLATEYLDEHDYQADYDHYCYEDTGHLLWAPSLPTATRDEGETPDGESICYGGTPEGYARADEDSWKRLLTALDRSLR